MWTDKGETVLKTEAGLSGASDVKKNSILAYKLNSDGEISNVKADTVKEGAVAKISSAFMTVKASSEDTEDTMYYFDDDVIIVTIETDETEGVANGCTYKDIGTADGSANNVYYVLNSENEVVFVAYDVDNAITHPATK